MSDEFLYRAAPAVRAEFADALYERLSRSDVIRIRRLGWIGFNRKTIKYALVLLSLTAIAVACARELFKQRYVQVGDLWVLEVPRERVERLVISIFDRPVSSQMPELLSVGQALESLPYGFRLPQWVPEGYSLVEREVWLPRHPDWSMNLNWSDERGGHFFIWACKCELTIEAPAGMWSETQVNGTPAILIQGRFPPYPHPLPTPATYEGRELDFVEREVRWEEDAGLRLTWNQGGARLNLLTFGDYLTEAELIRIAESMGTP